MRRAGTGIGHGLATGAISLLFVLPLLFLITGSLRTPGLPPPSGVEWIPSPVSVDSYRYVFQLVPLQRHLVNSMIVVGLAVPATVVVASWAGFAIARSSALHARRLVVLSVGAMMIPPAALWVPRFVLFKQLHLTDTLWPLVAPALMGTTPFFVLLFAAWYARLPRSVFEASDLEGSRPLATWWRVAVPLSRPAIAAVGLLAFVFHWSNFADSLMYLSRADLHTVPLGLRSLQTLEPSNFPILLAGAALATTPAVLVFFAAQRSLFGEVAR